MRLLSAGSSYEESYAVEPGLAGAGSVRVQDRMRERAVNTYGDRGYHPISNVLSIRMRMGRSGATNST
jgi:hypothetical protein